ncbi:MAG: hypothetical protein DRP06_02890 [Candidatus Aenigmatarchaeota archaeon]|nr:MAG: hypothetical protein DRP06_02890 [Candidatus Aenigmarchaeota archaeon]
MKTEEIIGLVALLCAVFLFGIITELEPISLSILLIIGGLVFLVINVQNNQAIFGCIVLIFTLLFYMYYDSGMTLQITLSEYYLPSIVGILILMIGFGAAYKLSN